MFAPADSPAVESPTVAVEFKTWIAVEFARELTVEFPRKIPVRLAMVFAPTLRVLPMKTLFVPFVKVKPAVPPKVVASLNWTKVSEPPGELPPPMREPFR